MGLQEFIIRYSGESSAQALFTHLRLCESVHCPNCGSIAGPGDVRRFRIACPECGLWFSLTSNTAMHGSNFPISQWLLAIYLVSANKKITSTRLALFLGVQRRTGWTVRERIFQLMEAEPWARKFCDIAFGDIPV